MFPTLATEAQIRHAAHVACVMEMLGGEGGLESGWRKTYRRGEGRGEETGNGR